MPLPVIGLPALLQAIATIGVGGAVGYKAQKDLQPVIKALKNSPEDMGNSELKMLRALLFPAQAIASEVKDLTSKSVPKLTGDGQVFGPDADQIEKERKDLEIILKPPTRAPEPVKPVIEIFPGDPVKPQQIPTTEKPEIQTKESFPDLSEELNKPQIFEQKESKGIMGTNSQEGGKVIKDVTAGVSGQKDTVPSLLEQGALAKPIKDFFNEDDQVVNYKIGDTIGAYGGTVERSLDIEANVKPDFNIDTFGDVIKERAKQFNQDAVFVAESVPADFEGANVGFSLDFGSDLKMKDALNISDQLSETAQLDGFTFKIKNLDTSGSSIYLPQNIIDAELTEKAIKSYGVTDEINKAGFMMPDGQMLNFSRNGNVRDTEHRRVNLTMGGSDVNDFAPMYDFMNRTGAIRLTGNANRLYAELSAKPSNTQLRKIVDEYNNNREKYDSMIISITVPEKGKGSGQFGQPKIEAQEKGIDLRKQDYRLPNEAFYEVHGEKANATDILNKFKSTDVAGKTFTGIRQLNIPDFSNISDEEALQKIRSLQNNMGKFIESTGLKTLDKPKTKFYNTKLYTKGKDY